MYTVDTDKKIVANTRLSISPWFIMIFFLLLATSGRAAELPVDNIKKSPPAEQGYVIDIADVLDIQVWKEPDLSRTQQVRMDGRISLPLLGDIDAAGKTARELVSYLKEEYSKFVSEPYVSVMLKESRSRRYYIVGQIKHPGEFTIDYPLTLLQAIARSSGFLEWAKTSKIFVIRRRAGRDNILKFDYDSFIKGKDLKQNIFVERGDTIIVP